MAKIYTDVLMIGHELSGLIACAMLAKRGAHIVHLPFRGHRDNGCDDDPFAMWPSHDDPISRQVIDKLELRLSFARLFDQHAHFSYFEEGKACIHCFATEPERTRELSRALLEPGRRFAALLNSFDPVVFDNHVREAGQSERGPAVIQWLRALALKKLLAHRTPAKALADLAQLTDADDKSLLIPRYFFNEETDPSSLSCTLLAALALKNGLTLPKDRSLTVHASLKDLFCSTLHNRPSYVHEDTEIKDVTLSRKTIQSIETHSGDVFVAKYYVDASPSGVLARWPFYQAYLSNGLDAGKANAHGVTIRALVDKRAISPAFLEHGFFRTQKTRYDIFGRFQIYDARPHDSLALFDVKNSVSRADQKTLILKVLTKDPACDMQALTEEANRILTRHFFVDAAHREILPQQPARPFLASSPHQLANQKDRNENIRTELKNNFRASVRHAPTLGVHGEFATGVALYHMLGQRLSLKLHP